MSLAPIVISKSKINETINEIHRNYSTNTNKQSYFICFFSHCFCTTPTSCKKKNNTRIHTMCCLCHNIRRYGTKCNGCNQGISPSELVRKSRDNKVFHLNCLTCFLCRRELSTGDQLYIIDDNKFMCKEDYLLHKHGQHSSLSGELSKRSFICVYFDFNSFSLSLFFACMKYVQV